VGANRPDAGVLGLLVVVEVGDLVRDMGVVWDGVFARIGVAGVAFVSGFREDDPVCCCLKG
jgi:hypothetical protein